MMAATGPVQESRTPGSSQPISSLRVNPEKLRAKFPSPTFNSRLHDSSQSTCMDANDSVVESDNSVETGIKYSMSSSLPNMSYSSPAGSSLLSEKSFESLTDIEINNELNVDSKIIALTQLQELDAAIQYCKATKVDGRKTRWLEHRRRQQLEGKVSAIKKYGNKQSVKQLKIIGKKAIRDYTRPSKVQNTAVNAENNENDAKFVNNNNVKVSEKTIPMKVQVQGGYVPFSSQITSNVLESMKQQFLQGTEVFEGENNKLFVDSELTSTRNKNIKKVFETDIVPTLPTEFPLSSTKIKTKGLREIRKVDSNSDSNSNSSSPLKYEDVKNNGDSVESFIKNYANASLSNNLSSSSVEKNDNTNGVVSCNDNRLNGVYLTPDLNESKISENNSTVLKTKNKRGRPRKRPLTDQEVSQKLDSSSSISPKSDDVKENHSPRNLSSNEKSNLNESLNLSSLFDKENNASNDAILIDDREKENKHIITKSNDTEIVVKKNKVGRPRKRPLIDADNAENAPRKMATVIVDVHNTMNGEPQVGMICKSPKTTPKKSPLKSESMKNAQNSVKNEQLENNVTGLNVLNNSKLSPTEKTPVKSDRSASPLSKLQNTVKSTNKALLNLNEVPDSKVSTNVSPRTSMKNELEVIYEKSKHFSSSKKKTADDSYESLKSTNDFHLCLSPDINKDSNLYNEREQNGAVKASDLELAEGTVKSKDKLPRFLKQLFVDEGVQNMLKSVAGESKSEVDNRVLENNLHKLRPKRPLDLKLSPSPEPDESMMQKAMMRKILDKTSSSPEPSEVSSIKRRKKCSELDHLFMDEGAVNMLTSVEGPRRSSAYNDDAASDISHVSSNKSLKLHKVNKSYNDVSFEAKKLGTTNAHMVESSRRSDRFGANGENPIGPHSKEQKLKVYVGNSAASKQGLKLSAKQKKKAIKMLRKKRRRRRGELASKYIFNDEENLSLSAWIKKKTENVEDSGLVSQKKNDLVTPQTGLNGQNKSQLIKCQKPKENLDVEKDVGMHNGNNSLPNKSSHLTSEAVIASASRNANANNGTTVSKASRSPTFLHAKESLKQVVNNKPAATSNALNKCKYLYRNYNSSDATRSNKTLTTVQNSDNLSKVPNNSSVNGDAECNYVSENTTPKVTSVPPSSKCSPKNGDGLVKGKPSGQKKTEIDEEPGLSRVALTETGDEPDDRGKTKQFEAVRQSQRFSSRQVDANYRDVAVLRELCQALNSVRRDESVRLVLFTGTGTTFCQGIDLFSLQHPNQDTRKKNAENLVRGIKDFLKALIQFPKPIIAGVNGSAMGLGVTMLPLFDLVIVNDKAVFYLPYAKLGQVPEGGATYTFPNLIGKLQALEAGLVSEILWPATFQEVLIPKVAMLAAQSAQTMEATKALMNHHLLTKLELSLESECRLLLQHWTSSRFSLLCKKFLEGHYVQLQKPVHIPL